MKKRRKRKNVKKNQTLLTDLSELMPRIDECVRVILESRVCSEFGPDGRPTKYSDPGQVLYERDAAMGLLNACEKRFDVLEIVMEKYSEDLWIWMTTLIWRFFGIRMYQEALGFCRHLLGIRRSDHLLFALPLLLAATHNTRETVRRIALNMKEFPGHPMMLMMAGDALISTGDFNGARRIFEQIDSERLEEFEMGRSLKHRMDFLKRSKSRGIGRHTAS